MPYVKIHDTPLPVVEISNDVAMLRERVDKLCTSALCPDGMHVVEAIIAITAVLARMDSDMLRRR